VLGSILFTKMQIGNLVRNLFALLGTYIPLKYSTVDFLLMQAHVYIFLSNKVVKDVVVREFMCFSLPS